MNYISAASLQHNDGFGRIQRDSFLVANPLRNLFLLKEKMNYSPSSNDDNYTSTDVKRLQHGSQIRLGFWHPHIKGLVTRVKSAVTKTGSEIKSAATSDIKKASSEIKSATSSVKSAGSTAVNLVKSVAPAALDVAEEVAPDAAEGLCGVVAGTADAVEEAGTEGAATGAVVAEAPEESALCATVGNAVTVGLDSLNTTEAVKSGDKTDEAEDGGEDALDVADMVVPE